ncbi:hypothetical protein [Ammoniphilus resinae]|uniref:Anaerobic ribonucleoside-triphosphate reductase n=1 Tax=Ammoniphilus resinae TaxID=861532 RepID=A0ABS4GP63_9BACL|nr:hypothetical protein [Ammoniphilus resinae]MBP1932055.1 anaerobic ribonucleoside-triphosphate reductase [Ammoniphilus resinae]
MKFIDRNCRNCGITLTEFEAQEYALCIDCHREENPVQKKSTMQVVRKMKNKKFVSVN